MEIDVNPTITLVSFDAYWHIHIMHQQLPMNGVVNYNTPQKQ